MIGNEATRLDYAINMAKRMQLRQIKVVLTTVFLSLPNKTWTSKEISDTISEILTKEKT